MQSVCVFCGAKKGIKPTYVQSAQALGKLLVAQNIELVYGGGSIGLMGEIATTIMQAGGKVTGVIPQFLDDMEVGHKAITELIIVESMHQRKQKMEELSEGVIAMPGGFGTLEELTEILTWAQLKLVKKPIGLLNTEGYYDPFLRFADHKLTEGFLSEANRNMLISDSNPEALLQKMQQYQAPNESAKMTPSET